MCFAHDNIKLVFRIFVWIFIFVICVNTNFKHIIEKFIKKRTVYKNYIRLTAISILAVNKEKYQV